MVEYSIRNFLDLRACRINYDTAIGSGQGNYSERYDLLTLGFANIL